jgi:hypothetical protein
MFPPNTTDVTPDSSTDSQQFEVPQHGTKEYDTWRQTGKLPESPAPGSKSKEASTPSKESSAKGEQPEEKTAPVSETGKGQEHKNRDNAATRLQELLADLKTAGLSPAELKTFKREAQKQDQAAAPAAKPASEQTAKPAELKAPTKPDPSKFATYEELEAARDKYAEDLAEYHSKKAIADYRAQQQLDAATREMTEKLEGARKRYPDADQAIFPANQAIFEDAAIPASVKAIVNDSPVLIDLLYILGSKAEDLAEFIQLSKSNPGAAIRKAVLLEQLVTAELAKVSSTTETTRGEDGKYVAAKPEAPEKKTTKAPAPPREASGRGSIPPDEVERAVREDDFASFRDIENRRDIEKRRKG